MSKAFFSIIIPAYNAEKYIEKCIHSVLSQSYTDCEVIIIDDGSVDGTEEFCRKAAETAPFISVYRIPHSGAGAARNAGLRRASGEYVIFLDADDYWTNSFLLEHLHDKLPHIYFPTTVISAPNHFVAISARVPSAAIALSSL